MGAPKTFPCRNVPPSTLRQSSACCSYRSGSGSSSYTTNTRITTLPPRSEGAERIASCAMSSTGLAALLALAAGLGGAVQIAVQGRLGDRVGSIEATATASLIGALIALAVLLLARRSLGGVGEAFGGPKWMLLGGVMSALIILAI